MGLRVLLVDDETIVRRTLKKTVPWAAHGMEVVGEASNGEEALAFLQSNKVDIVFLDLGMPIMDGFTLLSEINRHFPWVVRIVLSCYADVKYMQRTIMEDITGYLIKSDFQMEDIDLLLERAKEKVARRKPGYYVICYAPKQSPEQGQPLVEGWWLCRTEDPFYMQETAEAEKVVLISQDMAATLLKAPETVASLLERQIFWHMPPSQRICDLQALPLPDLYAWSELTPRLATGDWLWKHEELEALTAELKTLLYPASTLLAHVTMTVEQLFPILEETLPAPFDRPLWSCRDELLAQMVVLRQVVLDLIRKESVSADTAQAIIRCMCLMSLPDNLFGKANELATQLGFSRSHFSRSFSVFTGMTFRDYARTLRVRYVARKKEREGMSMTQIARELGYVNEEYFCKSYKIDT